MVDAPDCWESIAVRQLYNREWDLLPNAVMNIETARYQARVGMISVRLLREKRREIYQVKRLVQGRPS